MEFAGSVEITEGGSLSISIPLNSQSGPLGSVPGIGDLTVVWNQTLSSSQSWVFAIQAGAKIALADVNAENLPQAYQSGLGTNDVLLGLQAQVSDWNFAVAYQLSSGRSENAATRLKRGDDLLLRGGYAVMVSDVRLAGEVLAIKRLQASNVIISAGPPETFGDVPNSDQAQINLVARGSYPVSETLEAGILVALPMLKRDVNVDGLTRSLSLSAGLTISL
jgi:hypothetical protein